MKLKRVYVVEFLNAANNKPFSPRNFDNILWNAPRWAKKDAKHYKDERGWSCRVVTFEEVKP